MRTRKTAWSAFLVLSFPIALLVTMPAAQAQTQAQMNQSAAQAAGEADAAMNAAYKKLLAVLNPAQKLQLKKAQRAWLVFRDADADLLSSQWTGGTGHPMIYEIAVQETTEARTKELKAFTKEVLQESGGR